MDSPADSLARLLEDGSSESWLVAMDLCEARGLAMPYPPLSNWVFVPNASHAGWLFRTRSYSGGPESSSSRPAYYVVPSSSGLNRRRTSIFGVPRMYD